MRGAKDFLKGVYARIWFIHAEEQKTVLSTNTTGIDVSTVGCRDA